MNKLSKREEEVNEQKPAGQQKEDFRKHCKELAKAVFQLS